MRTFAFALVAMTVMTTVPVVAQSPADTLASCSALLENRGKVRSLALDTSVVRRLKTVGVTFEPSRVMRATRYPWEHQVQIALPPTYGKSDRKYPVLWVTDGEWFLGAALEVATSCTGKHVPEMIVVAVGPPPVANAEIGMRRNFDFSPNETMTYEGFGSSVHNAMVEAALKKGVSIRAGGAPQFLPFLVDDVRGQLAREYRMADDHTLFGHSGGGLFCAYALMARPAAFKRYICGSPSLAAGNFEVFRIEERYARDNKDLAASVFFGAGEAEVLDGSTWGIVSSTARMAEILKSRRYPSLRLNTRIFPGEGHISVVPQVLAWGMRAVWEKDFPARDP
jgi:predicted alpha/beta superfamily hydrolase